MTGFLMLMAIGFALYAAFLVGSTLLTLQHPPRRTYAWAVSRNAAGEPGELSPPLGFRQFEFTSRGHRLVAWDIDGLNPTGPLVVLTHGWSDSRVGALSRVSALAPVCSRLIAWDLPGHGESPGVCELGLREAEDLLQLIRTIDRVEGVPVILMGWSLGAGVSIVAAKDAKVMGVIAEASYRFGDTPARNVMRARGSPWRLNLPVALWIVRRRAGVDETAWRAFDRAAHAAMLGCPLLVLHGSADVVSPPDEARAIASRATHATFHEIPGAHHNDLWTNPGNREAATRIVRDFFERVVQATGVGRSS